LIHVLLALNPEIVSSRDRAAAVTNFRRVDRYCHEDQLRPITNSAYEEMRVRSLSAVSGVHHGDCATLDAAWPRWTRGSARVNTLPIPNSLVSLIWPPWISAKRLVSAKPSPVP